MKKFCNFNSTSSWNKVFKYNRYYDFRSLDEDEILGMHKISIVKDLDNSIPALWIIENLKSNFTIKYDSDTKTYYWYFEDAVEAIMFKLKWS